MPFTLTLSTEIDANGDAHVLTVTQALTNAAAGVLDGDIRPGDQAEIHDRAGLVIGQIAWIVDEQEHTQGEM